MYTQRAIRPTIMQTWYRKMNLYGGVATGARPGAHVTAWVLGTYLAFY